MTDDIVTRLREIGLYEQIFNVSTNEVKYPISTLGFSAADEIERLRAQINGLKNGFEGCCPVCEPVGEMNKKLREERDEARREVCGIHHVTGFLAGDYAMSRGWDCFPSWIHTATQVEKDFRKWLEASDGGLLDTIDNLRDRCEHLETDRNNLELENQRLRRELGQGSDPEAFVSWADAAHLDDLLDWCEFNEMNWHRALSRLIADRARLRAELFPIRKELEQIRAERDEARRMYCEEAFCHRFNESRFNERGGEATIIDSRQIAHSMGWDCYKENKENTND